MNAAIDLAQQVGPVRACSALGVPRATMHRRVRPKVDRPALAKCSHRALTFAERTSVIETLNSERFMDASPAEVRATLLDEGMYVSSVSTMYRLLRTLRAVRERRAVRRHPSYARPELVATGPNQVWTWDITKVRGPDRRTWFHLYVVLDLFSRYVVAWHLSSTESGSQARQWLEDAIESEGVPPGQLKVHADRGTSMRSRPPGARDAHAADGLPWTGGRGAERPSVGSRPRSRYASRALRERKIGREAPTERGLDQCAHRAAGRRGRASRGVDVTGVEPQDLGVPDHFSPFLAKSPVRERERRSSARPDQRGATRREPSLLGTRAWRGLGGRTLDRSERRGIRRARKGRSGPWCTSLLTPEEPAARPSVTKRIPGSEDTGLRPLPAALRHGPRRETDTVRLTGSGLYSTIRLKIVDRFRDVIYFLSMSWTSEE